MARQDGAPASGNRAVVFFHAHPDDEAIFTGGTMVRLATAGHRVVLVVATNGELGVPHPEGDAGEALGFRRVDETRRAAELLGAARVEFLGFHDSGLLGDAANIAAGAFWSSDTEEVANTLAELLRTEDAAALVVYDERGIYGHPDHVKVHRVGHRAAELAGTPTVYEVTVDREYLHFVETHLVSEAGRAVASALGAGPESLGLAASAVGLPTVLVSATVDVRAELDRKRAAMAAHASQIPETASPMRLPTNAFAEVYGYEWYVRHGPAGPIEAL